MLAVVGRVGRSHVLKAAQEQDTDSSLSGEWPVNWSLASYEDVGEFFQQNLFKDQASPGTTLRDVMSSSLKVVSPDDRLDTLGNLFSVVSFRQQRFASLSQLPLTLRRLSLISSIKSSFSIEKRRLPYGICCLAQFVHHFARLSAVPCLPTPPVPTKSLYCQARSEIQHIVCASSLRTQSLSLGSCFWEAKRAIWHLVPF